MMNFSTRFSRIPAYITYIKKNTSVNHLTVTKNLFILYQNKHFIYLFLNIYFITVIFTPPNSAPPKQSISVTNITHK